MDADTPTTDLTPFRTRCGELGLALTPQRLAIYAALANDPGHPSAEDLFSRVKPALPSLSLGTVYRTLETLELHGLVVRVSGVDDQARYDANIGPHHHLICVHCRRVVDFHSESPPLPDRLHGFVVLRQQWHVSGVCPDCQTQ